ncbi:MAG: SigB/SigF/SigG family RNA polymerase sigma factor, partial [Acidimicrobiia bacterium]
VDRELLERAAADLSARARMVELHDPLVQRLARRFGHRGIEHDDLVQVGRLALLKAIDRYDPERAVTFSTYATSTIVGELKRHFRDSGWTIRVPRGLKEASLQVQRATGELTQQGGSSPTVAQIAHATGLTEEEVLEAMQASDAYTPISVDAPLDASPERHVADTLGKPDERLGLVDGWVTVTEALRDFPERDRLVLYMRFFEDRTQSEIAGAIGVSQMQVSRILSATLARLRERIADR